MHILYFYAVYPDISHHGFSDVFTGGHHRTPSGNLLQGVGASYIGLGGVPGMGGLHHPAHAPAYGMASPRLIQVRVPWGRIPFILSDPCLLRNGLQDLHHRSAGKMCSRLLYISSSTAFYDYCTP